MGNAKPTPRTCWGDSCHGEIVSWKHALLTLLLLAVVMAGAVVLVLVQDSHSRESGSAGADWYTALRRVEEAQLKLSESSALPRPVLWGEPADVFSRRGYDDAQKNALDVMAEPRYLAQDLVEWAKSERDVDRRSLSIHVLRLDPALTRLREGAHGSMQPPVDPRDILPLIPKDRNWRPLLGAVAAGCVEGARRGRDLDAARLILDWLQMAWDQLAQPESTTAGAIGVPMAGRGFLFETKPFSFDTGKFRVPVAYFPIHELSREALTQLRDGLRILDRGLPGLERMFLKETVDYVAIAESMQQLKDSLGGRSDIKIQIPGNASFERDEVAKLANARLDVVERLAVADQRWVEYRELLRAVDLDFDIQPASLTIAAESSAETDLLPLEVSRRGAVAFLRVLRTAVHELLDEPAEFDDPFGSKIHRREEKDSILYWSAGEDGVDDGGSEQKDLVCARRKKG